MNKKKYLLILMIDALFLAIAFGIYITFNSSVQINAYIFAFFMISNILISYSFFKKGMHASFIFLGLLFLFQGGLVISFLISGKVEDITFVLLQGYNENLPDSIIISTLYMVMLSAFFILLSSMITYKQENILKKYTVSSSSINFILLLFLFSLPFLIYKNISYINYVMEHGGYMAIYTGGGENRKNVGIIVRAFALLAQVSFVYYFIIEKNKKRLHWIIFIFFMVSIMDLVIGLRGKFFVFWLTFIFFYKMKFKSNFSLKYIIASILIVAFISVLVGFIREGKTIDLDNPVAMFFKTQGVSLHVTAFSLYEKELYTKNAISYLIYPLVEIFLHQNEFSYGKLFANDLSRDLNSQAFENGYGTGSTYLAEIFLLMGPIGIIIFSIIIGVLLNKIKLYNNAYISVVSFYCCLGVLYLPRASFFNFLTEVIKIIPVVAFIYMLLIIKKNLLKRRV